MKAYHKRLAELYHKKKSGQKLTEQEKSEWTESLDAIMKSKTYEFASDRVLGFLWKSYRDCGALLGIEKQMWRKAMEQNLSRCWDLSQLEQLSSIAFQVGDVVWHAEIQCRIERFHSYQ